MQPYLIKFDVSALRSLPSWMEPRLVCIYHADSAHEAIDGAREHIVALFQPEVGEDNTLALTVEVVAPIGEPAAEPFVILATEICGGTYLRSDTTWRRGVSESSLDGFLAGDGSSS